MNSENKNELTNKNSHHTLSKKVLLVFIAFLLLLIVWGLCSIFVSFMKINKIVVEGENKYTESEVIQSGQIEVGMKMNNIDPDVVEKRLMEELTYISSVKVKRGFMGKLNIKITEDIAKYYTQISEDYFCLSTDFRLLETSKDKYDFSDLIYIEFPEIRNAIVGSKISYYDEDFEELIVSFTFDLDNSVLNGKIIAVDVSEKYNLNVLCKDYDVIFGAYKNMDTKLGYVELMEQDDVVKNRAGVVFDVSDPYNAIIKFKK